jgi:hypothetical protein
MTPIPLALADPTSDELFAWLKVLVALMGVCYLAIALWRQLSPRPPAGDLDKSLAALNQRLDSELRRVAEQISGVLHQVGQLTNVVNEREAYSKDRREKIYMDLKAVRHEFAEADARLRLDFDGKIEKVCAEFRKVGEDLHNRVTGLLEKLAEVRGEMKG